MLVSQNGNVQTEEKKEEWLRGWWAYVSIGLLIGLVLGEPNIYHDLGGFYKKWGFYLEVLGEEVMMFWVNDLLTLSTWR